jgi:ribonucleoside-diphosphate reductase alpha chain
LFRRLNGADAPLPDAFVDAQTLAPDDHLVMQAAVQEYVDSSISKTINVPVDFPFAAFADVYLKAYALGCKGCTSYRPNEARGAVLEVKKESAPAAVSGQSHDQPIARPETLPGATYKLNWPESDHAIYITINDIEHDGRRRPFEIFINTRNLEHYAWTVALTRMISAVFRRGGDVSFVVEELKAVFDPQGGQWMAGRYVPSLLAAIGGVIETHMIRTGFLQPAERSIMEQPVFAFEDEARLAAAQAGPLPRPRVCPRCSSQALVREEGCWICRDCGFSRCG